MAKFYRDRLHAGPDHMVALRSLIACTSIYSLDLELRNDFLKQLMEMNVEASLKYADFLCDLVCEYLDEARTVPADDIGRKKVILDMIIGRAKELNAVPTSLLWRGNHTQPNDHLPPLTVPQQVLDQLNRIYSLASAEVRELPCFSTLVVFFLVLFEYFDQLAGLSNKDFSVLYDRISMKSSDVTVRSVLVDFVKKLDWAVGLSHSVGPYAVSLSFVLQFLEDHKDVITDDTTTAEVVGKIIVPETIETKQTYIDAKLRGKHPNFKVDRTGCICSDKPYPSHVYFLSHAWLMPFKKLVSIATSALRVANTSADYVPAVEHYQDDSFLWIDVFCKNQHVPAPAMDEFETAMKSSKSVIFCLWPVNDPERLPVTLTRIWCLFEIWTCLKLEMPLMISCDDKELPTNFELDIDVRNATATFESDVTLILGLMESSLGIGAINETIVKSIKDGIVVQNNTFAPYVYCFDGEGKVLMADGTCKLVRHIRAGDKVYTYPYRKAAHEEEDKTQHLQRNELSMHHDDYEIAEVVLVTINEIEAADGAEICEYKGLFLTPEHPILVSRKEMIRQKIIGGTASPCAGDSTDNDNTGNYKDDHQDNGKGNQMNNETMVWVQPKDFLPVQRRSLNRVYNFELDRGHTVLINDVVVLTLGDNLGVSLSQENAAQYSGVGWQENAKRESCMEAQRQRRELQVGEYAEQD